MGELRRRFPALVLVTSQIDRKNYEKPTFGRGITLPGLRKGGLWRDLGRRATNDHDGRK